MRVDEVELKVEMVDDVPAHVGAIREHRVLGRLDSPENILANKLTALVDRQEPKDLADAHPAGMPVACDAHAAHRDRMAKMLQVRNVPDRVHRALRERAARRGKTLSGFVLDELERIVEEVPLDEWLEEVHRHPPTRLRSNVADLVRREREAR